MLAFTGCSSGAGGSGTGAPEPTATSTATPRYSLAWAYQRISEKQRDLGETFCPTGPSNYTAYDGEKEASYWRVRVQCIDVGAHSDALLREARWQVFEADGQAALESQDEFGTSGFRCADGSRCITENRIAVAGPTPTPAPSPTAVVCGRNDINLAKQSAVRIEWNDSRYIYAGSGFLLDTQTLVTNRHVVEGTTAVRLQFADGSTGRGAVVGMSNTLDIAVVRPDGVPAGTGLQWGNSRELDGAEDVWAIGFPKSLAGPPIITRGTVSRLVVEDGVEYIQTDAAVNSGNSGGALVDECGRVVGVVTLKLRNAEGIGFAQSERQVHPEVERLRNGTGTAATTRTPTTTSTCTAADARQCPVSGTWEIADTVTFGQDAGQTFRFTTNILEKDGQVAGTNEDGSLTFVGTRTGNSVSVTFSRTGGSGYFRWTLGADGAMQGTYEDYGAKNGGTSVASRK